LTRDDTLRAWLARHGAMIERIARTYERRPALVAELTQETALALWRALPSYRSEANERTYIARIAHNVCVSHVRKAVRSEVTGIGDDLADALTDEAPRPDESTANAQRRALLQQAVRDLPLSLRPVMSLHLEGFGNGEIAAALSLTVNNVGVRLNRGKAHLKQSLGKLS